MPETEWRIDRARRPLAAAASAPINRQAPPTTPSGPAGHGERSA